MVPVADGDWGEHRGPPGSVPAGAEVEPPLPAEGTEHRKTLTISSTGSWCPGSLPNPPEGF